MRSLLRRLAMWVAPTAYTKLQALDVDRPATATLDDAEDLRLRVRDLEKQLKEMRQDNRRVAELYDVIFERLREDNPLSSR